MKVYFTPCGIGLGHAGRCIPIAKKLQEKGVKTLFSTYLEAVPYVKNTGFPVVKVPSIGFHVKPDGTIDFRLTAANPGPFYAPIKFLKQVEVEIHVLKTFKPDIVVSDSRASPLVASKLLGIPRICILNQFQIIIPRRTRFLKLAKFADAGILSIIGKVWTSGPAILVPDFPPPYTISERNLRIPETFRKNLKLVGPILPQYPENLQSVKEIRGKLGLDVDRPLIFVPISGPLGERAFLIKMLQRILSEFPDEYQIVMSLGDIGANETFKTGNLTIQRWIPNRFEYLKACDVVVSRAGHGTITQSICYGKPMVIIPTPNHTEQLNNSGKASELGIASVIQQENLSRDTLVKSIKKVIYNGYGEKAVSIRREALKLNGLESAIGTIMDVAKGAV